MICKFMNLTYEQLVIAETFKSTKSYYYDLVGNVVARLFILLMIITIEKV